MATILCIVKLVFKCVPYIHTFQIFCFYKGFRFAPYYGAKVFNYMFFLFNFSTLYFIESVTRTTITVVGVKEQGQKIFQFYKKSNLVLARSTSFFSF